MWSIVRDVVAQGLTALWLSVPAAGSSGASPAPALLDPKARVPLEFRCDTMQVQNKPNRAICQTNVVIRRGDLLVCCTFFEGQADADWGWQRFLCTKDVRARRGGETMWADRAEFVLSTSELTLTGRPRLLRGKSLIEGARVIVDVKNDRARVEKPTGILQAAEESAPPPVQEGNGVSSPLPDTCPLPGAPAR